MWNARTITLRTNASEVRPYKEFSSSVLRKWSAISYCGRAFKRHALNHCPLSLHSPYTDSASFRQKSMECSLWGPDSDLCWKEDNAKGTKNKGLLMPDLFIPLYILYRVYFCSNCFTSAPFWDIGSDRCWNFYKTQCRVTLVIIWQSKSKLTRFKTRRSTKSLTETFIGIFS